MYYVDVCVFSNRRILHDYEVDVLPTSLDVCGDWVYWTNLKEHNLVKMNMSSDSEVHMMLSGLDHPRDVSVFHRERNHGGENCMT